MGRPGPANLSPPHWRRLVATLALGLLAAGPGGAGGALRDNLIHDARTALARGDGIAAEIALRKAMVAGASRDLVAARMGEAFLDQGDLRKAREWLAAGRFVPAEAAHGWRMRGQLELASRDFPAAGQAFDKALRLAPNDSGLWVDIARLRYMGGEQAAASSAADQAVRLNPGNIRALELRGLLVRDSFGLAAALPWFEAGLKISPDDQGLLGEYAATLGELGRAREMLTITRRMIALDSHSPRAFYLQAVLAARAGNAPLARSILAHGGPAVLRSPAGLFLSGMLELEVGNANLAVEQLDQLVRLQPGNVRARLVLARALEAAGNLDMLQDRFAAAAMRSDAPAYLLTVLARAHEDRGRRDLAGPLLDRAANRPSSGLGMWADGGASTGLADRGAVAAAGSFDALLMAGDVLLAHGDLQQAAARYQAAGQIRMSDAVLLRLVGIYARLGLRVQARQLVSGFRTANPRNGLALRLAAGQAAEDGDWDAAATHLDYLRKRIGGRDVRLLSDLAMARLEAGDATDAERAAQSAYALQPVALPAVLALAATRTELGEVDRDTRALAVKAARLGGGGPLLMRVNRALAARH